MSKVSTYDEINRVSLIIDTLVGSVNYYPVSTVSIYPLIDIIKLLVQEPLIFAFFDENLKSVYCTMEDLQYYEDVQSMLKEPEVESNLIDFSVESYSYRIAVVLQSFGDDKFELKFKIAPQKVLDQYGKLFSAIEQERDIAYALHTALADINIGQRPRRDLSSSNNPKCPAITIKHYIETIKRLRSVFDEALGELSQSPLLHDVPGNPGTELPYPNIFFTVQNATFHRKTEKFNFNYTTQVLLSNTQIEQIQVWGSNKDDIKCHYSCCPLNKKSKKKCLLKVSKDTINEAIDNMEKPLGSSSRSISDSVFYSGGIEFTPKSTRQDYSPKEIKDCIYSQFVDGSTQTLLIPIHIGGVPWIILNTFTSSDKADENSSWKHNYHIYRTVTRSIATRLRTGVKQLYLDLVAREFEREQRYVHGVLDVDLLNEGWEELSVVYPFDQVTIANESNLSDFPSYLIKSKHAATGYYLHLVPNKWYQRQILYSVIQLEEVYQACKRALDRVDSKLDASNKLLLEQLDQQDHTIQNILNSVTLCIHPLLSVHSDKDMSDGLSFINSSIEHLIISWQIALHPQQNPPDRLSACGTLANLLNWFSGCDFGRAKIRLTNNLPVSGSIQLDDVSTAYTILWNLLHNACKEASNEFLDSTPPPVEIELSENELDPDHLLLRIRNAGEMHEKIIDRFLGMKIANDQRTWKGLAVIQRKLPDVGWKISRVVSENGFTEIYILVPKKGR